MAFASRSEASANGFFSRRHKAGNAHTEAKIRREQRAAAQASASYARDVAAANRTAVEQVARLDLMLGKGVGAVRERARLGERIAAEVEAACVKAPRK